MDQSRDLQREFQRGGALLTGDGRIMPVGDARDECSKFQLQWFILLDLHFQRWMDIPSRQWIWPACSW